MNSHRFDALTRQIASPATRRGTLRLLAGGLLAGLLAPRGALSAFAAQPEKEPDCPPEGCVAIEGPPPVDIDFLLACSAQGLTDCAGACVDLLSDAANCGVCGSSCGAGACFGGACVVDVYEEPGLLLTCTAAGLTDCGGICVDIATDLNNCGGCGIVCGPSDGCFGGTCLAPPVAACSSTVQTDCGGVCVNLTSHAGHCGACFNSCPLGGVCQGGVCGGLVCFDGLVDCGVGHCVDLASDWSHCGGCEFGCFVGATCENGACV